MDSQLSNCDKDNDEVKQAKKFLEEQKVKDGTHYWIFSGVFLILSLISLFLYLNTRNNDFIVTPLLPIIFGIVGVFKSKSLRNKLISISFALIGLGIFLVIAAL